MPQAATAPVEDPRISRTRRVVLESTIALLVEGGYSAVTIEAVAARSGVAKSTIYRHWPGRLELVKDAFYELKPSVPLPTGGSVRERVVAVLEHLAVNVAASTWSACLPTLIDAAERDADAKELHCQASQRGRQTLVELLAEGIANGELSERVEPDLVADALAGPIFVRRLMFAEPLDPADVPALVDQVLGPPRRGRSRPSSDPAPGAPAGS